MLRQRKKQKNNCNDLMIQQHMVIYFLSFTITNLSQQQLNFTQSSNLLRYYVFMSFKLCLVILLSMQHLSGFEVEDLQASNVNYPVRLAYVDRINQWWPPQKIAGGIGVPGYADQTIYNYIALAFWSYGTGALDIVNIWSDPVKYFGAENPFGSTKDEIQQTLKKKYNDQGVKILISAFGATEFPTSANVDPIDCAQKLGNFVLQNNLDGVDIDWEDNAAMEAGKGEQWLIDFTKKLREILPKHIITHAPQAPYFKKQYYKNGAYVTVNKEVGKLIDFYNVQFYNQGDTKYDTYEALFESSGSFFSGTSVKQIIARGIPAKKIVIGKPVTAADASNTGAVESTDLGSWVSKAYTEFGWFGGVMYWQYISDVGGKSINNAAGHLKEMCAINKDCK